MEQLVSDTYRKCTWCGTEYAKPYNMTVERFWSKEVSFCSYNCAHMYRRVDRLGILGRVLVENMVTIKEYGRWLGETYPVAWIYRWSIHGVPVRVGGLDGYDIVTNLEMTLLLMGVKGDWDKRFWLVQDGLGFPDTKRVYNSAYKASILAAGRYDYRMLLIN